MEKLIFYYTFLVLRYIVIAGAAYLIFYRLLKSRFITKKIQQDFPAKHDYQREISFSFSSFLFFSLVAFALTETPLLNYTKIYTRLNDHSMMYFFVSILLAVLIHDTYFYWMHRLIHHPALFKKVHLVHHKSTNPTPWAAFAFHPVEAVLEAVVIIIIALLIPIHKFAIIIWFFISTVYNVYGHLGFEIYPEWLLKSKLGKMLNTSIAHNAHHQFFKGNYGYYFTFWDKLMKTERKSTPHEIINENSKIKYKSSKQEKPLQTV